MGGEAEVEITGCVTRQERDAAGFKYAIALDGVEPESSIEEISHEISQVQGTVAHESDEIEAVGKGVMERSVETPKRTSPRATSRQG